MGLHFQTAGDFFFFNDLTKLSFKNAFVGQSVHSSLSLR